MVATDVAENDCERLISVAETDPDLVRLVGALSTLPALPLPIRRAVWALIERQLPKPIEAALLALVESVLGNNELSDRPPDASAT